MRLNDNNVPIAPFAWYGGKSKVLSTVAPILEGCNSYYEPFAGSLAVLLGMAPALNEVVNDFDCMLVNTWRAIQRAPNELADYLERPFFECELKAFFKSAEEFGLREKVMGDLEFYDVKHAGLWLSLHSATIGSIYKSGVVKKPHGVHSLTRRDRLHEIFNSLSARLRHVKICCGDWAALLTPCCLDLKYVKGDVGVFLDPPYIGTEKHYSETSDAESNIAKRVEDWCRKYTDEPKLRIILAGHSGDYDLPGWREVQWSRNRGYALDTDKARNSEEILLLSPGCEKKQDGQMSLF